jgi:hypothetical protein
LPPSSGAHEELDAEWEAALAALPGSVGLWSAFLARTGRSFGAYSVSAQRHRAARSVGALAAQLAAARAAGASAARLEALEGSVLLLVYRAALAEHAAGYTEGAIGILQALFEFNVMAPAALEHAPLAARLASFEEFWEAEAPRVGGEAEDVGATRGWCRWYAAPKGAASLAPPDTAPPLATRKLPMRDETRDGRVRCMLDAELAALPVALRFDASRLACAQWAAREELLGMEAAVPLLAWTHHDEAEEDPHRYADCH